MIPKYRLPLSICGYVYSIFFALIKAGFVSGQVNWFFSYLFPIGIILLDIIVFFFLLLFYIITNEPLFEENTEGRIAINIL